MQLSTTRISWTTLHRNSTSLLWKQLLWWGHTLLEEQTSLIQVFLFQDFQLLDIFSSDQDTMESGSVMRQECSTIVIIQIWSTPTGSWPSANVQIFQTLIQTIVNQMTRQALSIPYNRIIIKMKSGIEMGIFHRKCWLQPSCWCGNIQRVQLWCWWEARLRVWWLWAFSHCQVFYQEFDAHFLNWFVSDMSKTLQTATHISCRSLARCTRKCCQLVTLAYRLLLSQFDSYLYFYDFLEK